MTAPTNVSSVLGRLTLEEKASLCLGSDIWHTAAVERLGIPAIMVSDGPHGLRAQPEHGDHVGLGGSLPATCFPTASALGSSWDPELVRRVGAALGEEARAQDVAVVLGPGINIKRSPLCGRNFEYFSEDPLLSGVLGAALDRRHPVAGRRRVAQALRGEQPGDRPAAGQRRRRRADAARDLPARVRARRDRRRRPWTVMCSYNRVNGVYASEHRWLLTEVLRDEWGFDGLVVSDWGAVHDRVAALAAGLDLEMPPNLGVSDAAIVAAVRDGELDEARARPGGRPGCCSWSTAPARPVDGSGGPRRRRPPRARPGRRRRVRGAAEERRRPAAAASGRRRDDRGDRRVRPHARATRAPAARRSTRPGSTSPSTSCAPPSRTASRWPSPPASASAPPTRRAARRRGGRARRAGRHRGRVPRPAGRRRVRGLRPRPTWTCPPTRPRCCPGSPRRTRTSSSCSPTAPRCGCRTGSATPPAILECWLSGQAAGGAVADLLLGAANPSGRLAETLPLRLEDNPSYLNFPGEDGHVRYGEGVFVGYRGYDALRQRGQLPVRARPVLHPRSTTPTCPSRSADAPRTVTSPSRSTCRITNTGDRAGKEVVQLYVGDPEASVARPLRELKAFAKVDLDPGESSAVTFRLSRPRPVLLVDPHPPMGPRGRRVRARRRRLLPRPAADHHGRRRSAAAPGPARRQRHSRGVARRPRRPRTPTARRSAPTRPASRTASSATRNCSAGSATSRSTASPPSPAWASPTTPSGHSPLLSMHKPAALGKGSRSAGGPPEPR